MCLAGFMRILGPGVRAGVPGSDPEHSSRRSCRRSPGWPHSAKPWSTGSRSPGPPCISSTRGSTPVPSSFRPSVPVLPDDTEASLSARILAEEHRLYPEAIRLFAAGRLRIAGRRTLVEALT